MIVSLNTSLISSHVTISILEYLPGIFVAWLIYIWIKKDDECMDIVLYSVYAVIIGFIINSILGIFHIFYSVNMNFMISIALMLTYFKETRRSGLIFISLALTTGIIYNYYNFNTSLEILGSILVAIISTILIYYYKKHLIELNQIIKAAYYVLK